MQTPGILLPGDPSKIAPRRSIARACFDPFKGNNQDGVFESIEEFDAFTKLKYGGWSQIQSMEGMVFQEVVSEAEHYHCLHVCKSCFVV
jgi:hypothetical protein